MRITDISCGNCKRRDAGLSVRQFSRQLLLYKHSRPYFSLPKLTRQEIALRRRHGQDAVKVWLCGHCERHLLENSNNVCDFWPAMVYKFLNHENSKYSNKVSFRDRWKLIPCTWRHWWEDEFQDHELDANQESLFIDVSVELEKTKNAIADLTWKNLAECMDKHFAYPEVRCPWGCSEFLHRTKHLPLKDFLWYYSNYEMQCYKTPTGKHWTDFISPSYPSPCLILEKFLCSPPMAFVEGEPVILCCREHSVRSTNAFLHVPESPTGTIYTPNANSFAPVAIRSRTNRNFKPKVFSDTFCTVKQVGGFGGIDSAYVTSTNLPIKCDALSNKRDGLSIQGRADIRAQIYDRCSQPDSACFMPRDKVETILATSERDYPDPTIYPEYRSATYIPCEMAVALQELMYGEGTQTIRVYANPNRDEYSMKVFTPPWPTKFVEVHPMDGHGTRIHRVMNTDFGVWMLLCMTGRVTDLWEAIADGVKDNRSWHGHWLSYATNALSFRGKKKNSKYFPVVQNVHDLFSSPLQDILQDFEASTELFGACCKVLVIEGQFSETEEELDGKTVVICINPTYSEDSQNSLNQFELRCLLSCKNDSEGILLPRSEWFMHCRHRCQQFWVQRGNKFPCRYKGKTLHKKAFKGARIGVYCRRQNSESADLQRRYLNAIGGQNSVYCSNHRRPLVLNHHHKRARHYKNNYRCACKNQSELHESCNSFGSYICSVASCDIAICDKHLSETKLRCIECGPESVLYLSANEAEFGAYSSFEDGAIRGRSDLETENIRPEQLGPTTAHEIPQDAVDCTDAADLIEDDSNRSWDREDMSHGSESDRSFQHSYSDNSFGNFDDDDDSDVPDLINRQSQHNNENDAGSRGSNEEITDECDPNYIFHGEPDRRRDDGSSGSGENHHVFGAPFDHFDTTDIPTTATGVEQREIEVEHYDADGAKIPLCVLLNQQGHLLTRTSHKLRMNKLHRSVCERMVSKNSSKVIPLVYAEAQLFPTTFWYSLDDGTIPGAVPTALWADKTTLNRFGLASMREHAKMRITNPALPTSVDPAYHFMLLDQLSNLGACGKHTKVVLQRGFADHQFEDGISFRDKGDSAEIYGESSENHANVHKLAALVEESRPHFFFTQTCNQSTCKGLRILREWITSIDAILRLQKKYGLDFNEARNYLRESAASYVSRSWNEVVDMWMQYIIYSPDMPLGPIDWAWYRKEFQDTEGNLAHIHSILRLLYDITNPKELEIVLNKIRGCISDLIHNDEYLEMKEKEIITSADHLYQILAQAKSYLTHTCHTRCQIPRTTQDGETFFVCKVKENYYRSMTPFVHSIEPIAVQHLPEAKKIYNWLGMMRGDEIIDESLISEYHVPKCSLEDPKFSPTNGGLFARFPSSQNLQYTTGRMLTDYLVKYCTKMDEVARAELKPPRHYDQTKVRAVIEQLHNTKITSNKILADKTRKKDSNYGRLITHTECLSVVLGEEIVRSTVPFVYFSTSPREYRQACFKQGRSKPEDVPDFVSYLANVHQEIRQQKGFPAVQLFSSNQMLVIHDERSSALSVDAITVFSVRPPELRFVNVVKLYFKWFERVPMVMKEDTIKAELSNRIKSDVMKCEWIDGLHMQIKLRKGALREIIEYANQTNAEFFGNQWHKTSMTRLFDSMLICLRLFDKDFYEPDADQSRRRCTNLDSRRRELDQYKDLFLSDEDTMTTPIPWTTPVYPRNRGCFLVQILLLFGRFETEYGLMNHESMKAAYIDAELFNPSTPDTSIKLLMTRYQKECLKAQSGSVRLHDRNLILAKAAFDECLLGIQDELVLGTPCVLQSAMKEQTTNKIIKQKHKMISSFLGSLYSDLSSSGFPTETLPNKELITAMHCNTTSLRDDGIDRHSLGSIEYTFPPAYDETGIQSLPSYEEQKKILEKAKGTIDRYLHGLSHKNIVVCGGPGNGKTTVCEEICLYLFSKGLRGTATSIVADRSKALGGMHIHLLCAIPMSDRRNLSPGRAAESALSCIYRKPELLHFWRELQFIYIDELGTLSAEMLATMDIIARKIKDSSRFLGGVLVVSSMDIHQLLPIDGTALMLSMNMMCEFNFFELKESVRASRDAELRELCNLTRESIWDDAKKARFREIIAEKCNFVDSFDDPSLPEDGIYVFGRRAPCQRIEDVLVSRMENDENVDLVLSKAEDEESSVAGNWRTATTPVSDELSRKLKLKSNLYLFARGRYEFTYNLHGSFQQGQLGILLSVTQDDVDNKRKLEFFKGPPGCKDFPSLEDFTEEFLEENGWEKVLVPFESSKPKRLWGKIIGKRSQYGVRLRIASTIHACQGATFGKLITAVSNIPDYGDLNFNLWDAAQVVVLTSRTRRCCDMYFVGRPDEVVEHLLSVLEMRSKYMAHITSMTQRLCSREDDTPILNSPPMFRPCDVVLDNSPAVYLLVSTRSYGYMYIGETQNIRRRLNDHNSGRGSNFTNNERLRPWALYGYVTGFTNNDNRRMFEQFWKRTVQMSRNRVDATSPPSVLAAAQNIAAYKNRSRRQHHQLRVVQCGNYEVRE